MLVDAQARKTAIFNPERARQPFPPASDFKVPHALIALNAGVVSSQEFAIRWDQSVHPRQPWWPEVWAKDHTLQTAIPNSVVWYFQEVAPHR